MVDLGIRTSPEICVEREFVGLTVAQPVDRMLRSSHDFRFDFHGAIVFCCCICCCRRSVFPLRIPNPEDHIGRKDFLPVEPQGDLYFLFRLSESRFRLKSLLHLVWVRQIHPEPQKRKYSPSEVRITFSKGCFSPKKQRARGSFQIGSKATVADVPVPEKYSRHFAVPPRQFGEEIL
jgi:hypothetical protein